jgi:hypothetical protein
MKTIIESIEKKNRKYFSEAVENIDSRFTVSYRGTTATIQYNEVYLPCELDLEAKARAKKDLQGFINEFRQYQFNQ